MIKFVIRRLLSVIPILLGVSIITFALVQIIPGDVIASLLGPYRTPETEAALRSYYGLDLPIYFQYFKWLSRVVHGDFGRSIALSMPVSQVLWQRVGNTLILTAASMVICVLGGIGFGVLAALRRNSLFDRLATIGAVMLASAPTFWLALMLLYVFALKWQIFPGAGMYNIRGGGGFIDLLWHLPLPATATALVSMTVVYRLSRSGMIDIMGQDYILAARARGLPERSVVRYGMRNLLAPIINITGLQVGYIFGSALFSELIFVWPGVGLLMYDTITARDVPVVQAVVLVIAVLFVSVNFITDLIQAVLDPRARQL